MSAYTASEGRVYVRGVYHTPESCERLLEIYRREAHGGDWFGSAAQQLADELEAAMRDAGLVQHSKRAA